MDDWIAEYPPAPRHRMGSAYYCEICGMSMVEWVETYAPCLTATNIRSIRNELAWKRFAPALTRIQKEWGF